jgi:hypothetical protein
LPLPLLSLPLSCHHYHCHQSISIILTFTVNITAAAADLTAVVVVAAIVTRAQHVVSQKPPNRGASGSSPANFFFLKILLSRTFKNSGGVMVRRHFPNLALPIFDVAPPSMLIRITAEIVETMG